MDWSYTSMPTTARCTWASLSARQHHISRSDIHCVYCPYKRLDVCLAGYDWIRKRRRLYWSCDWAPVNSLARLTFRCCRHTFSQLNQLAILEPSSTANFHCRHTSQQYVDLATRLRQLRPAARSLSTETAKTLVQAFISSRLDYCNSLRYGVAERLIPMVQSVQNAAARLITGARRQEHITTVLCKLHWLPVRQRVPFKLACIMYKSLHGQAPSTWSMMSSFSLTTWQRTASPSISQLQNMRCPTNTEQFRRQTLFCCRTQNLERSATGTATRRHQH